jgi:dynein intermediate chain 2
MEIISYEYAKRRDEFGHHPNFVNGPTEVESVASNKPLPDSEGQESAPADQWVKSIITTVELDCTPAVALHEVNTVRYETAHKGVSHQEGSWPADMKTNDFADKQRLIRRIKNDDQYSSSVCNLTYQTQEAIAQNNTIDLFEKYYSEADATEDNIVSEPPSAKTVSVFRDQSTTPREATSISWHPEGPHKLAVSYAVMQFQKSPDTMLNVSYIWDVHTPNEPDLTLSAASPLVALEYNPRSQDHIVGGSYNGLITFWDLRKGGSPTETSLLEHSHSDPVYGLNWIQSRSGNECVSVSTGGQILWWDIRKLKQGPTDSMMMTSPEGVGFGGTCMEYKPEAGATKYLVGTEQGVVLSVDRKAKKDAESTKAIKQIYGATGGMHHGPVYSCERNPVSHKYFLTVGDWTARVWMEDLQNPIMTTKYDKSYLTAGCWSATRPGVFFTTKADGTLDIWDFYHKQNDPTFSTKIGDCGLSCIRPQKAGSVVALGSTDGTVTVLKLSQNLSRPVPSEKGAIQAMFDRETKREKNLEVRAMQRSKTDKARANASRAEQDGRFDINADESTQLQEKLKTVEVAFYRSVEDSQKKAADNMPVADEGEEEQKETVMERDAEAIVEAQAAEADEEE